MTFSPRPYQSACGEAIDQAYAEGNRSALVVMATGLGKSVVLAREARKVIDRGKRVMVLAHRRRLIEQLSETIAEVCGSVPAIEMADLKSHEDGLRQAPVVVSTVQTQSSGRKFKRRHKFVPGDFGLVIVDEAHRTLSKSHLETVRHYMENPGCRLLGLTATPDRGDKRAMGLVYDTCCFRYESKQAIDDGWLVPIRCHNIHIKGVDFSRVHKVAGDLNERELADVMDEHSHAIASATLDESGGRKTLMFITSVAQARTVRNLLNRAEPHRAGLVTAEVPDTERHDIYRGFRDGRIRRLVNVDVCTEGYDEPGIRCLAIARPTLSRGRFVQMMGRALRPLPGVVDGLETAAERRAAIAASDKPYAEVMLFTGNAGRHSLVGPEDVLGGEYTEPEIKRAKEKCRDEALDVDEALREAREEIRKEDEEERERKLRGAYGQAEYEKINVSLFANTPHPRQHAPDRATPAMQALLRRARVPEDTIAKLNRREAGRLVGEIKRRWRDGLCSYRQAVILKQRGYSVDVTYDEASAIIDKISREEGWRK